MKGFGHHVITRKRVKIPGSIHARTLSATSTIHLTLPPRCLLASLQVLSSASISSLQEHRPIPTVKSVENVRLFPSLWL